MEGGGDGAGGEAEALGGFVSAVLSREIIGELKVGGADRGVPGMKLVLRTS